MALTKIKTSNLETSIDLTGINDTATSQILTVSDTGIDVTGTVTADGLTVDSSGDAVQVSSSNVRLHLFETDTTNLNTEIMNQSGKLWIDTIPDDASSSKARLMVDHATGDISFYEDTGTTAKFFWDASAERLGIGTSAPTSTLHVPGSASFGNSANPVTISGDANVTRLSIAGANGGGNGWMASFNNTWLSESAKTLQAKASQTGANKVLEVQTDALVVQGNGNVGIGVVPETWDSSYDALQIGGLAAISAITSQAANSNLHIDCNVYRDAGGMKRIVNDEASDYYQLNGTHNWRVASSDTADSAISWTTAMTIDNSGDVTIGDYDGNGASTGFRLYHSGGTDATLGSSSTSTSNRPHYSFRNPNGQVGSIKTSGSSTSFNTSSDYRLKENVVPMTGSIDRLKALNPSRFNFIADPDTTVDGFLAHEAQEVVPEAVTGEKDAMTTEEYEVTPAVMDGETVVTEAVMGTREVPDMQGIDQSKLVPLLVGAIQEQQTLIESLQADIAILKGATI